MTRRTPRPRAYAPDPDAPGRACDYPGCPCQGEYRAPKSRETLNSYWWFCLDHVREYNSSWDFYKGMTPGQIEAQVRMDTLWQRPTWPLGRLGAQFLNEDALRDPMEVFAAGRRRDAERAAARTTPTELKGPLDTLGLDWPVTLDAVKTRYKELAKRHHPDSNGGDRAAEERLKTINLAYAAVRGHFSGATDHATHGTAAG